MSILTKHRLASTGRVAIGLSLVLAAAASAQTPITEEVVRLTAFDAAANDLYGNTVAVSGDLAAIGSPAAAGVVADTGAVYLYERNYDGIGPGVADNWGLVKKIEEPDSATGDAFGFSVALDGDTLLVGAVGNDGAGVSAGAAYVYRRNQGGADNWGLVKKLTAVGTGELGSSVAIEGDTAVVGAHSDPTNGVNAGAAFVFQRNDGGADNWGQVKKLTAFDGITGDRFGNSVTIDYKWIAVGSPRSASAAGPADTGAVYIFERNDSGVDNWGLDEKITNPDPEQDDWFGDAVSADGGKLAIGVPRDGPANAGSVYLYYEPRLTNDWSQEVILTASDADLPDRFGWSVALDGEFLLVSGYLNGDAGFGTGSAYLFGRNQGGADTWGEIRKLLASDLASSHFYGYAVALDADTLVVGANSNDHLGPGSNAGAAYVVNLLGNSWREVTEFTAGSAATDEWMAFSLDQDGRRAVAGSRRDDAGATDSGSAYVFIRDGNDWPQAQQLVPSDPTANAFFGVSVAIDDDTIVVGADQKDEPVGTRAGAAYLYRLDSASVWQQREKITPSDAAADDRFGFSVALDGQTLVIGAYGKNDGNTDTGAAYVFRRNNGGSDQWDEVKKLTASDASLLGWFGRSVDVSGDTIVVGAASNLGGTPGAAYVFERNQGGADNWGEVKKLAAPGSNFDKFGESVSISGDRILVGAPRDTLAATPDGGAAYLFERNFDPLLPGFPFADNWGLLKTLTASDAAAGDRFGERVAIDGDTLAVSAPYRDESPSTNLGSVYLFERNHDPLAPATPSPDNWGELKRVAAGATSAGDRFGDGLALEAMTLLTGATFGDGEDVDTGAGYAFERNSACLASYQLAAGQWKQLSVPCDPPAPTTVQSAFAGSLDPLDYASSWIVYRWNPVTEENDPLTLASSVSAGEGYWIKTNSAGKFVDANGGFNAPIEFALTEDPADGRYNMPGHPFPFDVCWADVVILDGFSEIDLDTADPGGACQSDPVGPGCVMSRIAYKWTGSSYDAFDGQTPGARGTLESFDGIWVKAFKSGVSVVLPPFPSGGDCEGAPPSIPATAPAETPRAFAGAVAATTRSTKRGPTRTAPPAAADRGEDWFVRLTARSGELVERGSVFGQTANSRRGYDRHDLPDLPPFSSPSLTIVFPHPDWDLVAGDYSTDFHRLRNGSDQWTFEVRGSGLAEPVTLGWEAPPEVLARSVLMDLTAGRKIRPTEDGSYEITLGNGSHTFRWRLRPEARPRTRRVPRRSGR